MSLLIAGSSDVLAADPQVASLAALRRASTSPVEIAFANSTPRAIICRVPVTGRTAVEQARSFVSAYADLLLRDATPADSVPDQDPGSDLRARGVYRTPGAEMVAFQQYLGGLPVFGGGVVVGVQPGKRGKGEVILANGALLPAVQRALDLAPEIDEQDAALSAATHLGRAVPPVLGDPQLMIWSDSLAGASGPARLVWSVGVGGGAPWRVFVDANDPLGAVVFSYPLTETGVGTEDWDLDLEDANGENIDDTECFNPTTVDDEIADEDGLSGDYIDQPYAQKQWETTKATYLYYHDHLKRHSLDDDDAEMVVYTSSNFGVNNARYYHGCGLEFTPTMLVLDVLTHEFTHGVIRFSPSNLVYANQSGALNESFSDLMGEMSDPDVDWMIGEDLVLVGPIRSLKDPQNDLCGLQFNQVACGDPDRMGLFDPDPGDNGGVHKNSGIPNKAGYLMIEGGVFNGVAVGSGMGRWKFERLAYEVLRFLPSMAQFTDARDLYVATATGWATTNHFGFTGADVCTVRNAWAAVEIGPQDSNCNGLDDDVDDVDKDGVLVADDNCDGISNPAQEDWDGDAQGDACDNDDDADGCVDALDKCEGFANGPCYGIGQTDFDGDGLGEACDSDDDDDGVLDAADNCRVDANPDQFDGNGDGFGDVCDPDEDGDGDYGVDDNCTFVANADQADSDGDGLGDVCDKCPNVADNTHIYTHLFPGDPPKPYQPDTDGDGIPDACDGRAYGALRVRLDGDSPNPARPLRADGKRRTMILDGDGAFRLALPVCAGDEDVLGLKEMIEIAIDGLPESASIALWISDELDQRVARLGTDSRGTSRGMRFRPDCAHQYFLHGRTTAPLVGEVSFVVRERVSRRGHGNPWSLPKLEPTVSPLLPPNDDADDDGLADVIDDCPNDYNPDQADSDNDGVGDQCSGCLRGGCLREVAIDVVPGKTANLLPGHARGYTRVAILSDSGFDATSLVPSSIVIGGTGLADPARQIRTLDVDGDRIDDLLVRVSLPEMALTEATTRVHLRARTNGGVSVHGADAVTVVF